MYSCSAGREINGHDPALLAMIKSQGRIPFSLSDKTGVTKNYFKCLFQWCEMDYLLNKFTTFCWSGYTCRFLEDLNLYSTRHPIIINSCFPELTHLNEKRKTSLIFFVQVSTLYRLAANAF